MAHWFWLGVGCLAVVAPGHAFPGAIDQQQFDDPGRCDENGVRGETDEYDVRWHLTASDDDGQDRDDERCFDDER